MNSEGNARYLSPYCSASSHSQDVFIVHTPDTAPGEFTVATPASARRRSPKMRQLVDYWFPSLDVSESVFIVRRVPDIVSCIWRLWNSTEMADSGATKITTKVSELGPLQQLL